MGFCERSVHSVIKFNDCERITKQLTALITRLINAPEAIADQFIALFTN